MQGEAHLDRRLELDDARAQIGGYLLREKCVPQEVEPAPDRPVGLGAGRLDRGEPVAVGEEVGQRGLELDAPALVLVGRRDVELPPGVGDSGGERSELALDLVCDGGRVRHRARVYAGAHSRR